MGIGTSLFLIATGAILYFAVDTKVSGLEISTVGIILMVVGVVGLAISLFYTSLWARDRREVEPPPGRPIARDREYY
jgi:Domain of unknown function (DUF6458)